MASPRPHDGHVRSFGRAATPSRQSIWQINPRVGTKVSPEIDWLITQLARINCTNRRTDVIVTRAFEIRGRLLELRTRNRGTYLLHGNIADGFRLEHKPANRGLANELSRLERAARSRSKARWIKAWAAVSHSCRRLVWRPAPPPVIKRWVDKAGRLIGFERAALHEDLVGIDDVLLAPRAERALAAIVAARRKLAAIPKDDRRGNKHNDAADALAAAIRSAVFEFTGRIGFTRDPVTDLRSGPLVELGAALDARFGTRIGWRLIAAK